MNNTKRNLLLRLVFILVTLGALVWAVYGYLHNYNTLATWQKNLYVIIIVCAIPALFLLLFTGRIERKYGVKEDDPNDPESDAYEAAHVTYISDATETPDTANSTDTPGTTNTPNSTDSPAPANMADSTDTTETPNSGSD